MQYLSGLSSLYGDLIYFSDQFKKIVKRNIKVGYNLDVMRQSAVYSYDFLFNCTTVGQASDYDSSDAKL